MSDPVVIGSRSFVQGQTDTPGEEALEFPNLVVVQNLDVSTGKAKRRKGHYVLGRPTLGGHMYLDFNGGHVVFDTTDANMWTLGRYWTVDLGAGIDISGGAQGIWTWNHATDWPFEFTLSGTTLTVKAKTLGNAAVTLTATIADGTFYGIRLVRNNLTVTLWVNGVAVDTDVLEDAVSQPTSALTSMYLGRDQTGANTYDGGVFYARVMSKTYSDHALCYQQHPWPRAKHVLFNVDGRVFTIPALGTAVLDSSRKQLHGAYSGNVAAVASTLVSSTPVQMMRHIRDGAGKRYLLMGVNGEVARKELT